MIIIIGPLFHGILPFPMIKVRTTNNPNNLYDFISVQYSIVFLYGDLQGTYYIKFKYIFLA